MSRSPRDLTGERFGGLTAFRDAGRKRLGSKNMRYWWCRCECGREEAIAQQYLVSGRKTVCSVCARGPCVICGGEILENTNRNTCSEECHITKRRQLWLKQAAKAYANDPDINRKNWQAKKQKMQKDPEAYERYLENERRRSARRRQDPHYINYERERNAQRYAEKRDEILQKRKERFGTLPPEEKDAVRDQRRKQGRRWRQQWREEIANDPERYEEYLQYHREKNRESEGRKALAGLTSVGSKLGEKRDDDERSGDDEQ